MQFTASGDIGASDQAAAVLGQIASIRPDLHLALGDLSYDSDGGEQDWCDFVTEETGVGFPFELLSGNHESDGENGNINDFAACLPNRLPGLVGTYGREYYVDVPQVNPLVRFVMISPGLTFPNGSLSYTEGGRTSGGPRRPSTAPEAPASPGWWSACTSRACLWAATTATPAPTC